MTDTLEKLLIAVVSFAFGIGGTVIADLLRDRRRRLGLRRLMCAEARAFLEAIRWTEKSRIWVSTNVRRLAELIRERYSEEPERWTTCKSRKAQQAISDFYLDCAALLDLMEEQERRETAKEPSVIGLGNYEGIARRTENLLFLLGEPK